MKNEQPIIDNCSLSFVSHILSTESVSGGKLKNQSNRNTIPVINVKIILKNMKHINIILILGMAVNLKIWHSLSIRFASG